LSRGQVLRQIVDSSEVQSKYFNQAYAVMEYLVTCGVSRTYSIWIGSTL